MAQVETQAHLAFRCDPEWGVHKCSGFKPVTPRAYVVSLSFCFNSKLFLTLRFLRRGRLRVVFKRSRCGRRATILGRAVGLRTRRTSVLGWQQCAVRGRAFGLRARAAFAQG